MNKINLTDDQCIEVSDIIWIVTEDEELGDYCRIVVSAEYNGKVYQSMQAVETSLLDVYPLEKIEKECKIKIIKTILNINDQGE